MTATTVLENDGTTIAWELGHTKEEAREMRDRGSDGALVDRLRRTLVAARGDMQIRERLRQMLSEPGRLDEITRELGAGHTLVRDLLAIAPPSEATQERAA